jgi:2-methylcitrate dehydratase PrpD
MSMQNQMSREATGVTWQLSRYAVATRLEDLPVAVQEQGVRAFINWVGCVLGAVNHDAVMSAKRALAAYSGPEEASLPGAGQRFNMMQTALFNGMAATARVFDDTYLSAVVHPTSPVGAAALAVGEHTHSSGPEFLAALIVGVETACRAADMLTLAPGKSHLGLYMTGIVGGIGSAVAAGKLLQLSEQQMVWAMGIAVAQASGVRALHGSQASPFMAGNGARAGVTAALLARAGMTSTEHSLEGDRGFADIFASSPNSAAAIDGLGEKFDILDLTFKPFPCGIVSHAVVDACLLLAVECDIDASKIERVDIEVCPPGVELTGIRHPKDHMNCRNSLHHWAAVSFMRRRASIAEEECIHDPQVIAMRDRIHASATELPPDAANVRVTLKDGQVLEKSVEHCIGSRDRPMNDDEIDGKFLHQAQLIMSEERAKIALKACRSIEILADVGRVMMPLTGDDAR